MFYSEKCAFKFVGSHLVPHLVPHLVLQQTKIGSTLGSKNKKNGSTFGSAPGINNKIIGSTPGSAFGSTPSSVQCVDIGLDAFIGQVGSTLVFGSQFPECPECRDCPDKIVNPANVCNGHLNKTFHSAF